MINTGTELLLGNVTNTHVGYFGRLLFPLGLRIGRQTTVPDGLAIREALLETFGRADVVLVSGGLGPTTDDMTREVVAELLGMPLVEDAEVLEALKERYRRRGYPFQERSARQAQRPEQAEVLPNENGSAPGLYIPPVYFGEQRTPHIFLLPGPPRELQPMFEKHVLPRLQTLCPGGADCVCRIYRCVGIGESSVETRIGLRLEARGDLEVGYCARPNEVDFRLVGSSDILDAVEAEILAEIGEFIASFGEVPLEETVVAGLRERGWTVAVAESCTGGRLANRLTDVPGASAVFLQGFVTYSNEAKASMLGIPPELIQGHGAVSEPVARAMAEGALEKSGARFALSTTGIAGPDGGTPDKPVGTVFVGLAEKRRETRVMREYFPMDRDTFKQVTTQAALDLLRRRIRDA